MEERYIVNERKLSISKDLVDVNSPGGCDFGTGIMEMTYYGVTDRGNANGQVYKVKNCFKTRKEAKDRLIEVITEEIKNNKAKIDEARHNNLILYEKLEKLLK